MSRGRLFQQVLDAGLFVATLAAVAASFIERLPQWLTPAVLVSFVVIFFMRWWVDDDRRAWVKSNWFDLVLVVLLSSPVLRLLTALRLAGLAPALRIGTLIRANRHRLLKFIIISGESLPSALALMFTIVFVFGASVFALENGQNPQFGELQDGLWWAFVTLTTVGYGDMVPVTQGGRIVAVLTMVLGIAVYSLTIANLTAFIEEYRHREKTSAAATVAEEEQTARRD